MAWLPTLRAQRLLRDVYADVRRHRHGAAVRLRRARRGRGAPRRARRARPPSAGFRGYAVDSQRTIATRALAERCEHRLFLSATPHNGYSESFTALLEMIDGRRFSAAPAWTSARCATVAVRRLKADLKDEGLPAAGAQDARRSPRPRTRQEKFALLDRILADERAAQRAGAGPAASWRCC